MGAGGGQRRELNVLKRLRVSDALLILLWIYEDGSFDLRHFLSSALSSDRWSQRTSDSQELEGAARAGLEERGNILSRQEVKVENKVSVAEFTSRAKIWVGEGREEDTTEERCEGERE